MAEPEKKRKAAKERLLDPDALSSSPQTIALIALLLFLLLWSLFPNGPTTVMLAAVIIGATGINLYLTTSDLMESVKSKWSILPAAIGLLLLAVLLQSPGQMLLIILLASYVALSMAVALGFIKIQTAIIMGLLLTAVLFRAYPAMPGSGSSAGHLISMDDPYFHYKQTERLYELGDVPDKDLTIYPPDGRGAPQKFPYYYNTYLALLTSNTVRDVMLLYPVLIAAFGAIAMFLFLRELTGDWKSGMLGGFFFATMPAVLSKSVAGAVEEDLMGMVLGIFSLYLLAKAFRTSGRENLKYSLLSGVAFFITLISWKGVIFLYAVPFTALAIYALAGIILKHDMWNTTRSALLAGIIPVAGNLLFINPGRLDLTQLAPYGALLFMGLWAEVIRVRLWKGEDRKTAPEKRFIFPLAILVTAALLAMAAFAGVDRIVDIPQRTYENFAGTGATNYLVDKTISEQAAFSRGDLLQRLSIGYGRYNIAEVLTLLMAALLPLAILYHFFKKDKDRLFDLLRAYLIGLVFFLVAMQFVWLESRLVFSQSLGFLLLGAMVGLILPSSREELPTWKVIPLLIIIVLIPFSTFYPYKGLDAWGDSQRVSGVHPAWFLGVEWLDENIEPGYYTGNEYINGDFVLTWWDYGHFITALSDSTVIADPLQANEEYIMRTARFFYNTTSEKEAIGWLMEQPWNPRDETGEYKVRYIILDDTLINKASALAFLGTNHYEYPNGYTAVDGVCEVGQVCQNVENGLEARRVDGDYVCDRGEVCVRDQRARTEKRRCCEPDPAQCCNMSLSYKVINQKNGSARLMRGPGTPVYGRYTLETGGAACRPEYVTSTEPVFVVEGGERRTVTRRFLYTGFSGLPYADGGQYPAFLIMTYEDGTQSLKFISRDCSTKDAEEVLAGGADLLKNLGYGRSIGDGIRAPQIFVHAPSRWMDSMFTELYLKDAANLQHFEIIEDAFTQETSDGKANVYPAVKIYRITYPDKIPEAPGGEEEAVSEEQEPQEQEPPASTVDDTGESGEGSGEESIPNMTFDRYDPELREEYGLTHFPAIVWNCEFKKPGKMSNTTFEEEALYKLACIMNDAEPQELCLSHEIFYDENAGKVSTTDQDIDDILNGIARIENSTACGPEGSVTTVQVFYPQTCESCAEQKPLLDKLEQDFGEHLDISYYCVGGEDYCVPRLGGA